MLQMSFMCGPFAVVVAVWPCGRWSPRRRRRRRCCIHHSPSSKTPSESHFPKETKNNAGLTDLWLQFRAEKVAWGSVFCGWGNISVLGYQYPECVSNTLDCIQPSAHPQADPYPRTRLKRERQVFKQPFRKRSLALQIQPRNLRDHP